MQSDVIIIGGGFAGTAAAITLARANRNVQLIDSGAPRNRFSEHSHGILGLDGVAPGATRRLINSAAPLPTPRWKASPGLPSRPRGK